MNRMEIVKMNSTGNSDHFSSFFSGNLPET